MTKQEKNCPQNIFRYRWADIVQGIFDYSGRHSFHIISMAISWFVMNSFEPFFYSCVIHKKSLCDVPSFCVKDGFNWRRFEDRISQNILCRKTQKWALFLCLKMIRWDFDALWKINEFLNYWKILNFLLPTPSAIIIIHIIPIWSFYSLLTSHPFTVLVLMKNYIHDFAIFIFNHSECVRYSLIWRSFIIFFLLLFQCDISILSCTYLFVTAVGNRC